MGDSGLARTTDPAVLIPGDPAEIRAMARDLGALAEHGLMPVLTGLGHGLDRLASWQGAAGAATRESCTETRDLIREHTRAVEEVVIRLEHYADSLAQAQLIAAVAVQGWEYGRLTKALPGRFVDGMRQQDHAAAQVTAARETLQQESKELAAVLRRFTALLPAQPSFWDDPLWYPGEFLRGLRESIVGGATLIQTVSPERLFGEAQEYRQDLVRLRDELARRFGSVPEALRTLLNLDTWAESGARWAGEMSPFAAGFVQSLRRLTAESVVTNVVVNSAGEAEVVSELNPAESKVPLGVVTGGRRETSAAEMAKTGVMFPRQLTGPEYINTYGGNSRQGLNMRQTATGEVYFHADTSVRPTRPMMIRDGLSHFEDVTALRDSWAAGSTEMQEFERISSQWGYSPQRAALETPTGRVAADFGLTEVEFVESTPGEVAITFRRPTPREPFDMNWDDIDF